MKEKAGIKYIIIVFPILCSIFSFAVYYLYLHKYKSSAIINRC